ncbi:MAG: hypothetical protein ACR2MG_00205 [Pyrinomonadaceae bacterium]
MTESGKTSGCRADFYWNSGFDFQVQTFAEMSFKDAISRAYINFRFDINIKITDS